MKYLVVYDHEKTVLDTGSPMEARAQFKCKRCVTFNMKASKWNYRNVRIYRAADKDEQIAAAKVPAVERPHKISLDQIDWVEAKP